MRKLTILIVAGVFVFAVLIATPIATPGGSPHKRKRQAREKAAPEDLAELVRRAERAAEAARAEARRAREQTEIIQQQLARVMNELVALRRAGDSAAPANRNADAAVEGKVPLTGLPATLAATSGTKPPAAPAHSQDASVPPGLPDANPQSADRLATLEEQIEINTAQIKEQAQTKVESDSRFRVRLTGMVLFNTYLNTNDSSVRSTPTRAPAPSDLPLESRRNLGANLRQSIVGFAMEGPHVGGARLSAETEFDFYGTNGDSYRGNVLGNLRLRTASTRLDWARTSLTLGLRPIMFSPRNPTSLASVWYPALSEAGNLWQWRPQIIIEHRPQLSESSELVLQGGLTTPFGETLDATLIEGGPNYQGRVAFRHALDSDRQIEFGVGGLAGKRSFTRKRTETTYVASGDWLVPFGGRFEVSGEVYFGKANNLGEQSGSRADSYYALSGPIDNPATTIRGIHAFGGWSQLTFKARRDLDFNFAFGLEDPRNSDVLADRRNLSPYFKNQATTANFIYQLQSNFLISLEYHRLWTDYAAGRRRNDHYNLSFGYLF